MKEEEMQLAVLAEPIISLFLLTAAVLCVTFTLEFKGNVN